MVVLYFVEHDHSRLFVMLTIAFGSYLPTDHTDSEQICLALSKLSPPLIDVVILVWVPGTACTFHMQPDHFLAYCLLGDCCVFDDVPFKDIQDTLGLLCAVC